MAKPLARPRAQRRNSPSGLLRAMNWPTAPVAPACMVEGSLPFHRQATRQGLSFGKQAQIFQTTPAARHCALACANDPFRLIARHADSDTVTAKPRRAASSAE